MTNELWPITSTPYKVQTEALKASGGRKKFAYFCEMGLGKTQIVLAEFERARRKSVCDKLMIICPKPLITVWIEEARKVGIDLPIYVKPETTNGIEDEAIIIYNIDSVIAKAGETIPHILRGSACFLAIDESVTIKNFKSKRWKTMRKWISAPRVVRILSGYPMVQNPLDYWTQLSIVGGQVPTSPYAFRNRYCRMGGFKNKEVIGVQNEKQLAGVIGAVSFQAKKKDWTDLPDKIYTTCTYELSPKQKRVYAQMYDQLEADINGNVITVEQAMHRAQKLQQVGSGFMYDEVGDPVYIMHHPKNPKFKALDDVLETINTKVIIFAHYKPTINQLIERYNAPFIRGGMKPDEVHNNVTAFNQVDDCPVIICQSTSGKYGFTLLGNSKAPCHTSIYFENSYSLDARVQSEDRNHRHGQFDPVTYVDMAGTPVEANVIDRLQKKKKLADLISELAVRRVA